MDLSNLRTEYKREPLDESAVDADPVQQFARWFQTAVDAQMPEVNAMTLATIDGDLRPSARIVLLKGSDDAGFVFYTNYASRKGEALAAHPAAALLFHWVELSRQVRIEGRVAKVDAAESDAYFTQRPRGSQLGARASPQSHVIAGRAALEALFAAEERAYRQPGNDVPRPPHWGGYRLVADSFEFWQGRESRLHDRIRYRRVGAAWVIDRLAP